MGNFATTVQNSDVTRRGFLKGAGAFAGLAALSGLAACSKQDTEKVTITQDSAQDTERVASGAEGRDILEGTWVTAACWHNCGGRCLNKALVRDGVVVRQKTDDTHEDSPEFPQQRGCLRGRSQRKQVYAEDRLKYPMKRSSWAPGGGEAANGALRGKDTWERISWDEAFELIAGEMHRIQDAYGNRSILLDSWTMNGEYTRVFGAFGGFINGWGSCSLGNYTFGPQYIGFGPSGGGGTCNDRFDLENVEQFVLLGVNSVWSASGMPGNIVKAARDAGAKFIGIDPVYNETYSMLNADWVPIYPGSDTAFLLGVANAMLEQDENGSLIDWDFLYKATIGFDADHMPEEANPQDNFKDYLLGTYDGQAKDAEWASVHCGAPAEKIREVARAVGRAGKVAILSAWAPGRTNNSDNLSQILMTVGAMGGHMGKSGHMTGVICGASSFNHGPSLVVPGGNGLPAIANPSDDYVNDVQAYDMVLGKPYNYTGQSNDGIEWKPVEMRTADIRMIFHGGGNRMQSRQGIIQGIEAHRAVDLVVTATTFFTNDAKYADIVLPVNTEWEREGGISTGNREMMIMYGHVVDSMYESQDDQWIVAHLADALGLNSAEIYPFGRKQQLFNQVAGATVANASTWSGGAAETDYQTLVTITQEDIDRWGVDGQPQEGIIPLSQLEEDGIYQIPRSKGNAFGYVAFEEFAENPEEHPSEWSQSGKLEVYSQELADKINGMGYENSNVKPIPTFIEPVGGHEDTFADFASGTKGEYPYQVVTMHYMGRSHTTFANIPQLQEAFVSPLMMSAQDAASEGITTGDTVKLTSAYGATLRTAVVTNRIIPGVLGLTHGAWSDYSEEENLDRGGADNILFGNTVAGQGTSGYNTLVVKIEKYDETLVPDAEKPRRVVSL